MMMLGMSNKPPVCFSLPTFEKLLVVILVFQNVTMPISCDQPLATPTDDKNLPSIQLSEYRLNSDTPSRFDIYRYGPRSSVKILESLPLPDDILVRENNTWVIQQNVVEVTFSCSANFSGRERMSTSW